MVLLAASLFIMALAVPVTNEVIGGIWSESRLYTHALVTGNAADPEAMTYIFGTVQIVHDVRWRQPIRLVQVAPIGGKQFVVYDRDGSDAWAIGQVNVEIDRVFPELPSDLRARIAASFRTQIEVAEDSGVDAALAVVSKAPRPFEDWYRSDGTGPDVGVLQNATPVVFGPGTQIWHAKFVRFLAVWLLLTGLGIWACRSIMMRGQASHE